MNSFVEKSYEAHRGHLALKNLHSLRERADQDLANGFRHDRMLAYTKAFHSPGDSWITLGDGLGADAHYLETHLPEAHVTATDISGDLLPLAQKEGLIQNYAIENGESLSYADDSVDWVLIKEALHHFPRPYAGLYEALRVARKGVVLIEPNDPWLTNDQYFEGVSFGLMRRYLNLAWSQAKLSLKKALGRPVQLSYDYTFSFPGMTFESVGNFLYTFSRREFEKVGCSLGLSSFAVSTLCDVYIGPGDPLYTQDGDELLHRVQSRIAQQERLATEGMYRPNIVIFAYLKQAPGAPLKTSLHDAGMEVVDFPVNPYL